jgi:hypothetical protein
MPDPYDYTSAFANLQSPGDSFLKGIQGGVALNQLQIERQQKLAALAQQQQMQSELASLSKNPTPEAIGSLMVKYPALSEQLKRATDVLTPAQQQAQLDHGAQVYAAVLNDQPEVAQRLLTERAAALRNSGNEREAAAADMFSTMIKDHPEFAKTTMGLRLASAMGPDKFTEAFKGFGAEQRANELQPGAVRKGSAEAGAAESEAQTKAITAKYADSQALADLTKKNWDVKKIVADIDFQKESNRIAAMKAAIDRESNGLKRQELQLKINDAVTARDDKVRAKVADAESAAASIDNMLDKIIQVKSHPGLNSVVGSIEGRLPAVFSDQNSDAIAQINTLGSQAFLSQVSAMKGQGSLSNAEGEKLQSALTNLSRAQSEDQFKKNLDEATRILIKGRNNVSKRYGVPLGNPDTPAAATAGQRPPLSSFGG